MGEMIGFDIGEPYAMRCNILKRRGIALWDVLASSRRPGSLDSAIDIGSATVNDFSSLLKCHQDIKLVCFNGKKSRDLFERLVPENVAGGRQIKLATLPSSSPAHAAMHYQDKLTRWMIIGQYTDLTGSQLN